ncbi:hypothetical protein GCM10022223_67060 [Kineosporia mesophila]|uniref:Methyltransferase family protein n=1 Tax=Kineosporia mesophila TaxID=566012 RepID=A0ABP7ARS7_9ACTN|nr:hypothetical protein [Kineosporia mesophila]MCD5349052.1 hypothetical protein [Kineosporia mesophila]
MLEDFEKLVRLSPSLDENQAEYFLFGEPEKAEKIRVQDYSRTYRTPGLYEYVVQGLLDCRSPATAAYGLLQQAKDSAILASALNALDLGAGTGIVGSLLQEAGVSTIVGIDYTPEAKEATERDRAGVYRAYLVTDVEDGDEAARRAFSDIELNCLVSAGALGGGHLTPIGLGRALNLLSRPAPFAITVRSDMLDEDSSEGFGAFFARAAADRELSLSERRPFRHRLTAEGKEIMFSLVRGVAHTQVTIG